MLNFSGFVPSAAEVLLGGSPASSVVLVPGLPVGGVVLSSCGWGSVFVDAAGVRSFALSGSSAEARSFAVRVAPGAGGLFVCHLAAGDWVRCSLAPACVSAVSSGARVRLWVGVGPRGVPASGFFGGVDEAGEVELL